MRILLCLIPLLLTGCFLRGEQLQFPAGIDHGAYEQLLQKHVDERGLIAYDAWREDEVDRQALDAYLAQYEPVPDEPASGADRQAGLINLYNALVIREVLRVDPEESLWDHDPFDKKQHLVGGQRASLNDVEHGNARPDIGYRVHAALVCAAMSCPPLARQAFTAENVDAELDERMAVWLAMRELNRYEPDEKEVQLSKIVSWFRSDFEAAGGIPAVLAEHGPEEHHDFFAAGDFAIHFLPYDKSLNAQERE